MTPTLHARQLFAAVLLAITWPATATAHDFFLLPGAFTARPAETVSLSGTVSAAFPQVETAVSRDRLSATTTAGAASSGPLQASSDGKLQFTIGGPGIAMAAASVAAREVDYPEATLDVILKEYGVEGPAAAAAKALPRPRTLKVVSRRFAKTLICVDGCRDRSGAAARAGYALEFVATDLELEQRPV